MCCAGLAGLAEADWAAYFAIRVLWILWVREFNYSFRGGGFVDFEINI